MPTILMTILTGISLSISGGVMQSITHNDLVSPFTLGISAAAAFGASLCIVFGGSILHSTGGLILGAFTASCLCISLVYGYRLDHPQYMLYFPLKELYFEQNLLNNQLCNEYLDKHILY